MDEPKQPLQQRITAFLTSLTGLLTATAALIGALVAIFTATGVIGGGKSGNTAANTTTSSIRENQSSWTTQANAVCARTNDTIAALPDPHSVAPSDIASYLKTSVVLEQRMLRELNALPIPKD